MTTNSFIVDCLVELKEQVDEGKYPVTGICGEIFDPVMNLIGDEITDDEFVEMLENCFKSWPKFSGNDEFPVPSGDGRTPSDAYHNHGNIRNFAARDDHLWDKTKTRYAKNRYELLEYMIEYFTPK